MRRVLILSTMLIAAPAGAQDAALGRAAVGADSGAQLGIAFSALPQYYNAQGALVGGLSGAVLGGLGAIPMGGQGLPAAAPAPTSLSLECRSFKNQVEIEGEKKELSGTACKEPDGSWRVVQ